MTFGTTFDKRFQVGDLATYRRNPLSGLANPPAPQASSPFTVEVVALREQGYLVRKKKPGLVLLDRSFSGFDGESFYADQDELS